MKRLLLLGLIVLATGCTHAPPQLVQLFTQVNQVYDPARKTWSSQLAVFVQGSSPDGNKVFDRMHVINDEQNLYFTLGRDQWTVLDRQSEYWVGSNGLSFTDGKVPLGTWRVQLVTRSGQKVESEFHISPQAPGTPEPRKIRVELKRDGPSGRYTVSGWVDDYLVWPRDAKGAVLARIKTVGPSFAVQGGAQSVQLYSYDKIRGEGLIAGPFPVQAGP